jgi:TonB family protein
MKYFSTIIFILFFSISFSQSKDEYYNAGVKALQKNSFQLADSLFTLAIKQGDHNADVYVNRAIARKKTGNYSCYCTDLLKGIDQQDKEATSAFWKDCAKKDSMSCSNSKILIRDTLATLIHIDSILNEKNISIYNIKGLKTCFSISKNGKDTIFSLSPSLELPSFPGGDMELFSFLRNNIHYPETEKENGIQGKVFISFIVDKDGGVTNIELYKGLQGGPGCDKESLRVINLMPKWKPGKYNGKYVKVRYILPIAFKLFYGK